MDEAPTMARKLDSPKPTWWTERREHLADAWDLQMSIEEVATQAAPVAGALLDYEKFFDYFQPELVQWT